MAYKNKKELKDVFMGLSEMRAVKGGIEDFKSVTSEIELPVLVDSLSMSMGEPTKNSIKVHGLQTDWAVSYTAGEFEFSCTIPSTHKEISSYFFGEANEITGGTIDGKTATGYSVTMSNVMVELGLILINETGNKAVLVKKLVVTPRYVFEDASTSAIGIALSGTLVVDDSEGNNDDIAFLDLSSN